MVLNGKESFELRYIKLCDYAGHAPVLASCIFFNRAISSFSV